VMVVDAALRGRRAVDFYRCCAGVVLVASLLPGTTIRPANLRVSFLSGMRRYLTRQGSPLSSAVSGPLRNLPLMHGRNFH
jgi:hypothetical protein